MMGWGLRADSESTFAVELDFAFGQGEGVYGVWLRDYDQRPVGDSQRLQTLSHLRSMDANWVALGPEIRMPNPDLPQLSWHESLESCRAKLRRVRDAGFKVMLLPRIESPAFFEGKKPRWRGDIAMGNSGDWQRFHDRLEELLVEGARLAEAEGAAIYCLGLEYLESTRQFPDRWRAIIRSVRREYRGLVTYSANWYREFEEIQFWDALDFIGIGAYFPLGAEGQLDLNWSKWRRRIEAVANRCERCVVFTEVGYPNLGDASRKPWDWQSPESRRLAPRHQARCFEAMFLSFENRPWFRGLFVWQFHPDPKRAAPWEYDPRGKPAEDVIKHHFQARTFGK